MIEHFKRLFEYDLWANRQILNSIQTKHFTDAKINLLFSHILNSQQIWLSRVKGNPVGESPWDIIEQDEFAEAVSLVNKNWLDHIKNLNPDELRKTVTYKNTAGEEYHNTLEDIITHMLNHSTYHRAQISSHIKSNGNTPPPTDFIVFARRK